MRISEAKDVIKELYLKTDSVPALISERGVGKTSAFKQCTEELNIGYIDLYGAALEGPDFMGLPDKDRAKGITRYLAPQFLPTVEAVKDGLYPEKGILVLEEINRVGSDTTSVLYPLLLDREVNGHKLADGWKLGVTMNPDNMNYLVNSLDDAMIDRFVSIQVDPNLEDYIKFSQQNGGNNDVLNYLQSYPEMLLIVKKDSTATNKSPTPRGWTKVQEIMNNCSFTPEITLEVISGVVGATAAASFQGFMQRSVAMPSITDLLNDFKSEEKSIKLLVKNSNFDLLANILNSVVKQLQPNNNELSQTNKLLNILPKELQILFFKELSIKREDIFSDVIEAMDSFDGVSDDIIDIMSI